MDVNELPWDFGTVVVLKSEPNYDEEVISIPSHAASRSFYERDTEDYSKKYLDIPDPSKMVIEEPVKLRCCGRIPNKVRKRPCEDVTASQSTLTSEQACQTTGTTVSLDAEIVHWDCEPATSSAANIQMPVIANVESLSPQTDEEEPSSSNAESLRCEACKFMAKNASNYERHVQTKTHLMRLAKFNARRV